MLRDLALTRIDRRDLPRLFYWGSFRRQGLPALLMVYGFSIPMALTAVTTLPFPFDWTPVYLAFWACVAYLRLPLDFMMNLAISWRLLFKTGKKGLGQLYAALLLFIAFPVAHLALNAAIEWLHSDLLDGWTRASDVFRLGYSEVAYVFMQAGLSAALLLGGLVLARRSAARIKGIGAAMAAGGAMAALLSFRLDAIALPLACALSIVAALALAVRWGFRKPQRLPWLALWLGAALAIAPPESLLLGASGPRLSLGPLFLFFGGFSSGAMFLCLALKSWFALRCFRSFVAEWDQDLDERFPAG